MTAPLGQRMRCAVTGHDWRRAIAPREGYYLRCRRCWVSREADEVVETTGEGASWEPRHHGHVGSHSHA